MKGSLTSVKPSSASLSPAALIDSDLEPTHKPPCSTFSPPACLFNLLSSHWSTWTAAALFIKQKRRLRWYQRHPADALTLSSLNFSLVSQWILFLQFFSVFEFRYTQCAHKDKTYKQRSDWTPWDYFRCMYSINTEAFWLKSRVHVWKPNTPYGSVHSCL